MIKIKDRGDRVKIGKYIIKSDSISVGFGVFRRTVKLDRVVQCYADTNRYYNLVEENGRETRIDLMNLPEEAESYFVEAFRNNNISIRKIGVFEESEKIVVGSPNTNFVMKRRDAMAVGLMELLIIMVVTVPLIILGLMEDATISIKLILIGVGVGFALLMHFVFNKYTTKITVDGDTITYKAWFRKPVSVNLKDISWVGWDWVKVNNAPPVQELQLHVGDKVLNTPADVSRDYLKYDMFVAYLQDNGVKMSLDPEELLTYEKVLEDEKKDVPELLNTEEYAFSCNDDYIIENGIFEGMKLDDELDEEPTVSRGVAFIAGLQKFNKFVYFFTSIATFILLIIARAKLIGIITCFIGIGILYTLVFLISAIIDVLGFNLITKNAKCYKATVFNSRIRKEEKTVYYAYDAGDCVRLIEALDVNEKLTEKDYKLRYNVPIYIWANPDKLSLAVEGTSEKPNGKSKKVLKLILIILLELVLIIAALFSLALSDKHYEKTENDGYESLLVEYDENYGEYGTENDLVFPYENMEKSTIAYKWACKVTSIYAYLEDGNAEVLGGHARNWDSYFEGKEFLEKAWKITDRQTTIEQIEKQIKYGHQASCRAYIEQDKNVKKAIDAIERDYGDDFDYKDAINITEEYFEENGISTKEFYRTKGAACAYVRFGEDALAAYDYLRLIRVVNICNECCFLTDDEFMNHLYNFDVALQQQYDSFEDIHECYYYGEMFRLAERSDYADETINDIVSAIDNLEADTYYISADAEFKNEIVKDWLELLVKKKDL